MYVQGLNLEETRELAGCCNTPGSESLGWGASEAPWETVSDPPPNSDSRVMSSVEAKLVYQKYDEMMELLRSYRERIYQQWVSGVDKDCHFNLGQPLIQRDPVTNLIRVNFSKAVGAVCFLTGQAQAALRLTPSSRQHKSVGLTFMSHLPQSFIIEVLLEVCLGYV